MVAIIMTVIAVQAVCVLGIIFILRFILERRLVNMALKEFSAYVPVEGEPKPAVIQVVAPGTVSAAAQAELQKTARNKFGQGVQVQYQIDKGILGGLIITFNKRIFDYNLRDRLQEGGFLK